MFWIIRVVWIYEEYCIAVFLNRMNVILRILWKLSASALVPICLDINFTDPWRLQDRTKVRDKCIHVIVILLSSGNKQYSSVRMCRSKVRDFWPNKPKANNIIASQDFSILKQGHDADTGVSKAGILETRRNGFVSHRFHLDIIFQRL
jgi:hypothetical protein